MPIKNILIIKNDMNNVFFMTIKIDVFKAFQAFILIISAKINSLVIINKYYSYT